MALIWTIPAHDVGRDYFRDFQEALETGDLVRQVWFLQQSDIIRGFLVRRGKDKVMLKAVLRSLCNLLNEKYGDDDFSLYGLGEVIDFLTAYQLPLHLLSEMTHIGFHLKIRALLFDSGEIVDEAHRIPAAIRASMLHNQGTWLTVEEREYQSALILNQQALSNVHETDDEYLKQKIEYGILLNKTVRPASQYKRFGNIRAHLSVFSMHDALRAGVEQGKALYTIAQSQAGVKQRQTLEQLIEFCQEELLLEEKQHGLPHIGILALELMGQAKILLGTNRKTRKSGQGNIAIAERLRREYAYRTPLWT